MDSCGPDGRWRLLTLLVADNGCASAGSADRLDEFKALARRYSEAPDAETAAPLLAQLFSAVDGEVIDSLQAGGVFRSPSFIQDQLQAFSDEWGGVAFTVSLPGRAGGPTLGLFAVTRGEPRGSLRIYGRSKNAMSLLASSTHEGTLEVRPWPPAPDGAVQFLAAWIGSPGGRGSRTLLLELWRQGEGGDATRVWTSAEAFPDGLRTTGFAVKNGELRLRYEVKYPGWKPGCVDETQQEDFYHQGANGELVMYRRQTLNGWHRELHAAVSRFFDALSAKDEARLAELVPDVGVRARLPRGLEPESVCDERAPGGGGAVVVAATQERAQQRVPWSLSWRRSPTGWRLAGANPVLQ